MRRSCVLVLPLFALLPLVGCTYTVKVEPIHLTVDVNIKIDRALDDFFAQPAAGPAAAASTTGPATTPAATPAK